MPHVGNDIVDLKEPFNRGKSGDTRFLTRVFTTAERDLITSSSAPDTLLWALWAAKEAAYKLLSKTYPAIPSIPRRYDTALLEGNGGGPPGGTDPLPPRLSGCVAAPGGRVPVAITVTEDYVHCLAVGASRYFPPVLTRVVALPNATGIPADSPSQCVRDVAVRTIADRFRYPLADIAIRRLPAPVGLGPPQVFLDGAPSSIDLSLSHDGRFGAVAMTVPRSLT